MVILDDQLRVRWANQMAADLWADGLSIKLSGQFLSALAPVHALDGSSLDDSHPAHPFMRMLKGNGQDRYLLPAPELTPHRISWSAIRQMKEPFWLLRVRNLAPQEQALFDQQVFLNQLAHELRTPLAIVLGSLQRLERSDGMDPKCQQQLQIAREEARRINRLLIQLTLLSELDTGRYRWSRRDRPLSQFVEIWLSGLEPRERDRLRLNLDAAAAGLLLNLDQKAFNLVLGNLLDNSLRYGSADTTIHLEAAVVGDALELVLIDQGPGIPDDARAGIFDRFRRLERSRDVIRSDGSGLGLAVVKTLVEAMDGSIDLLPHRVGEVAPGLGVRVRWPIRSGG